MLLIIADNELGQENPPTKKNRINRDVVCE